MFTIVIAQSSTLTEIQSLCHALDHKRTELLSVIGTMPDSERKKRLMGGQQAVMIQIIKKTLTRMKSVGQYPSKRVMKADDHAV